MMGHRPEGGVLVNSNNNFISRCSTTESGVHLIAGDAADAAVFAGKTMCAI